MQIILRRIYKGVQARFVADERWAPKGRNNAEAVGNLVLGHSEQAGIQSIKWDLTDERTKKYVEHLDSRHAPINLEVADLPTVTSPEEAKELVIRELPLPIRLRKALWRGLDTLSLPRESEPTLGDVCQQTRAHYAAQNGVGDITLSEMDALLTHYKLSFRQE